MKCLKSKVSLVKVHTFILRSPKECSVILEAMILLIEAQEYESRIVKFQLTCSFDLHDLEQVT